MEFDINYWPRSAIKAQALADFIVECTIPDEAELEQSKIGIPWLQPSLSKESANLFKDFWALYVDGSSNSIGAGTGLILVNPKGVITEDVLCFKFSATNNGAEYEALIVGLKIARELKVDQFQIYSDF